MQYLILKLNEKTEQVASVGSVTVKERAGQRSAVVQFKKIYKQNTGRRFTGTLLVLPVNHGGFYTLKKNKITEYKRWYHNFN